MKGGVFSSGGGGGGGKKKSSGGEAYSLENDAVPDNVNGDVYGDHSENDCSSRSKEDRAEKNEEEELEDYDDQEEEYEDDNEKEEDDNDERSNLELLDDGFYEIETIRRKRVRKGQLQYLIKWRGWPETANTWEPLENLQSIADVVEAFEDSLRSGKSSRKRKRKSTGLHTQSNKKKTSSSIVVAYNITDIDIGVVDKTNLAPSSLTNTSLTDHRAPTQHLIEYNVDIDSGSKQIVERNEENEYDPKLSELRGTISTNGQVNGLTNGVTKVVDLATVNNRRIGAKKRKSGSVKRFKKDLTSREQVEDLSLTLAQEFAVGSSGPVGYIGAVGPSLIWNNTSQKNVAENCRNIPPIVKIIKPIDFASSVSNNCQDVLVTFVAVRADGNEVIVDNNFLKIHNPLLLIDFYENHLKYRTP